MQNIYKSDLLCGLINQIIIQFKCIFEGFNTRCVCYQISKNAKSDQVLIPSDALHILSSYLTVLVAYI